MAITPFTQPMKQGDLVPYRRQLPTRAIAEATKGIVQRDVRNRDAIDQMQQRLESSIGRSEVLDPVMDRYRQQIEQIASDGTYDEDTRQIQQLAREAQEDIGLLEQQQEALNKQRDIIQDIEKMPQNTRNLLLQSTVDNARLGTTEEGRIDPNSLFSPIQFGNVEDPTQVAVDSIKSLEEKISTTESGRIAELRRQYPELSTVEILRESGVSQQRMERAINQAYNTNPEIQNYIDARSRILASQTDQTLEEARASVQGELEGTAKNIARNRAFSDLEGWKKTIPESKGGDQSSLDSFGAVSFMSSPTPQEEFDPDSEAYKTDSSYREARLRQELTQGAGALTEEELQTIDRIRKKASNTDMGVVGAMAGGQLDLDTKTKNMLSPELARKWSRKQAQIEQLGLDEFDRRTMMYTAGPENATDLNKLKDAIQSVPKERLRSLDIEAIEGDEINWTQTSDERQRELLNQAISSMDSDAPITIDQNGQLLGITVSNSPNVDESLRGKTIRLNLQNVGGNIRQSIARAIGGPQGSAIEDNINAENVPLRFDRWSSVDGKFELRGEINDQGNPYIFVRDDNGETVNYSKLLEGTSDMSTAAKRDRLFEFSRSVQANYPNEPIGNPQALQIAIQKAAGRNVDDLKIPLDVQRIIERRSGATNREQQLEYLEETYKSFRDRPMRFTTKGSAVRFGQSL